MSAVWIDNDPVPLSRDAKIERETHKLEIFDDCEVAIRVETGLW